MAVPAAPSASRNRSPVDVRSALREGMARLGRARVPSPALAAELLLMHVLGRDRAWMYAHAEQLLHASAAETYGTLVERRAAGEPTQYLTGRQEFWGLEFEVTPAVFIPRPETEHVMEVALERLGERRGIAIDRSSGEPGPAVNVADVGTGSGCLAIALAGELPDAHVFATDLSSAALQVARRNAQRHGLAERIRFFETDLLGKLLDLFSTDGVKRFDLIVSNPPYLARNEAAELAREVRDHEPGVALFGGPTGTELYERLIEQAAELLAGRGVLVMELGYNGAGAVGALLRRRAEWSQVRVTSDLAGIPRVMAAERVRERG